MKRFGIGSQLLFWLALVVLPIVVASWVAFQVVDARLSEQVESDLVNVRRVEAARIDSALGGYERHATSLAGGPHVISFVETVREARFSPAKTNQTVGGQGGFDLVDPLSERPLDQLATALLTKATATGAHVAEVRIIGTDGSIYGQTAGFSWVPYDPTVIDRAIATASPRFGNAFRNAKGDDRLGVVAPIIDARGVVIGSLIIETPLGPILDLIEQHEGIGATSEAHLAQMTPEGDAQFITLLRFERTAAFEKVVPAEMNLPINQALTAIGGRVVRAQDYRGVDSVLAIDRLERTGWGLVIKIDQAEAAAPIAEIRIVGLIASAIALLVVFLGWIVVLLPKGRRLQRVSKAAERVSTGDYHTPIGDEAPDAIGVLARIIDRLAAELDEDIAIRSEVEARLRHRANHDELTGLWNRQYASDFIRKRFAESNDVTAAALMFLDLNGFKNINDAYGHGVGDEVLTAVAHRLSSTIRGWSPDVVVARWGGDEFVIVLPNVDQRSAERISQRVERLLENPISTSAGEHVVRCSIGLACWEPGDTADAWLNRADSAMFEQKGARTGGRAIKPEMVRSVERALEEHRVEVWYQPVVEAVPGGGFDVTGVEALVRIQEDRDHYTMPADFLTSIQGSALGLAVDQRVLMISTADLSHWRRANLVDDTFTVAVNVGVDTMRNPEFAQSVTDRTRRLGLPPESLMLEVSECVSNLDLDIVASLRQTGILLAIDDVGVQHSNLDRLVDSGASVAKIDRRWLDNSIPADPTSRQLLAHVVNICRDLGMQIIAEGVETKEQVETLRALGVTTYQGFYFGKAQPSVETTEVLRAGRMDGAGVVLAQSIVRL